MGGVIVRLSDAVTRRKTVNPAPPGLQQSLTPLDLAAVGMSGVVGVGGYVYVGVGAAEWAGPSVVLSVLLATVSAILTGAVCAELCICMPRGGGVYTHVYATLGELPAVLVTSTLLLDFTLLSAIAARSSSQYLSAATNYSLSEVLLPHLYESPYLASYCDVPAAGLALLCTVMVAMGTKVRRDGWVGDGVER
ncbi:cationic amino acid transporter 4-like [Macrobrachium nipponense]|uniref:cationic amino acid transporter 4-like n=1 Tax=Macrobrachium nipponense TaxID=159736 RepID=UPI0030C7D7BE